MMKSLAIASGLLALTVGSAWAADPVTVAMHDWTGPYIGLNAGYGFGDQVQYDDSLDFDSGNQDIDGWLGGGQIGYNFQSNQFVMGVETDFQFAGIEGDFARGSNDWGCNPPEGNKCSTEVDWFGTARLRLGYAFDNILPYVTGGVAYGSVKSDIINNPDFNLEETQVGWTLGGGLEMAFAEHFTGRLEYLYVDLGETDANGPYGFSASAKFNVLRAGVNYAF